MRHLALVAMLAVAFSSTAWADKDRADKLFEDGRKYLAAKEYALACTAFEQSHEADPAIGTQLNIALCYEDWGKIASAYRAYLEAERLAQSKGDDRARGARKKVDELDPKVPRVTLEIPPDADPSAVIFFDNKEIETSKLQEALLVDPGKHTIEARVPGKPAKVTEIEVTAGEKRVLAVEVPTPDAIVVVKTTPRSKGKLYGGLALTVGGAAAIGVAAFVSLAARQDYSDAVENCPGLVCRSRSSYDTTQDARSRANLMTYVGAGGVVLAGVGVYLMVTSGGKKESSAPAAVSITPVVSPESIGVSIGGSL